MLLCELDESGEAAVPSLELLVTRVPTAQFQVWSY